MSTPIPPNIKLEGLDLYAPRRPRTPSAPPLVTLSPHADEGAQAPAAAAVSLSTRNIETDDAFGAARSLPDQEPPISAASLPLASTLIFERDQVDRQPSAFRRPWLQHHIAETAPRRRLRLDPEIVPPPPAAARTRIVVPMLIVLIVGYAAVIGLTMVSTFQPDVHSPKRTSESIPTATLTFDKPAREQRLIVNVQKAFTNEPLPLDVAVDSATGHESLVVAGLAPGTRLSRGVPVSDASWQLAPRDFSSMYVYAPKDFIGTMHAAINLLSADQMLIETRATRLEWIAKVVSSLPAEQIVLGIPRSGAQLMSSEDTALMERGRALLKSGDVASARLLFQHLANAGIADAALVLATTYDPQYLAQHNVIGVAGDETKARDWYQRASKLGSAEAGRILPRTAAD
jgi:hypothetical protein